MSKKEINNTEKKPVVEVSDSESETVEEIVATESNEVEKEVKEVEGLNQQTSDIVSTLGDQGMGEENRRLGEEADKLVERVKNEIEDVSSAVKEKEYQCNAEEFEKLKLFLEEGGDGRWNSALITLWGKIENDLALPNFFSQSFKTYQVHKYSEEAVGIKLHSTNEIVKFTLNFNDEKRGISVSDFEVLKNDEEQEDIPVESEETTETETEKSEDLSVVVIVKKINKGERVDEKGEMKLRKEIEKIILAKGSVDESKEVWTDDEGKMMAAYIKGIDLKWFKEGNMTRMEIDFDLKSIEFNDLETENEKKDLIEERKKDSAEKLIEQNVVENEEEINDNIGELKRGLQKKIEIEAKAYEDICKEQSAEDLFNESGREKMKNIIEYLKKSNQIELNLERLDYYNIASDSGKIDSMIREEHVQRDYIIRMLEQSLLALEQVKELLDKKEEDLNNEERSALEKIAQVIKENPKMTIVAVAALLAGLGLIAVYGPGIYAGVTGLAGEEVAEEIIKATMKQAVDNGAKKGLTYLGVGAVVGGTGLIAAFYAAFDEGKRDDFMKWITNKDVPTWSRVGETNKA
ncbi:MAG: hypothetical protein KAI57_04005 [Candidatus Pacebacteria bacterium]|nr:hypothetical protein [Candidatus Paceibacterota bacterium]